MTLTSKTFGAALLFSLILFSCKVYNFRDVSVPANVKTIRVYTIANQATYRNPLISSRITNQLEQKVSNLTRLIRTNKDDADYQVSGYISSFTTSTVSISNQRSVTNRLTVSVHITLRDVPNNKTREFDVSRDFDFSASLSFDQAVGNLMDEIVKNMTDEIFNRIFSNW